MKDKSTGRRQFLKKASLGLGYVATNHLLSHGCEQVSPKGFKKVRLRNLKKPLAIAMWDYSWLLRHHKLGEFEDWNKVLDELVERGYNAIRIDCFPHFVAADKEGKITENFTCPKNNWNLALWGNEYSTEINPRQALLEFLPLCAKKGIYVGLSTWFSGHGTNRNTLFKNEADFVRAWDETLTFLDKNKLLDNVIYIDVLNEYPLWHGFSNLTQAINKREDESNLEQHKQQFDFLNKSGKRQYNPKQIQFYNNFISTIINDLSKKWSQLDFFASQTSTLNTPWTDLDVSNFAALDVHIWFIYNKKFSQASQYFNKIHTLRNDTQFKECYASIQQYWKTHKRALVDWMDLEIEARAKKAAQLNIPCGNTEGWGAVFWMDHPHLDWDWIKETGEIGAKLGAKHNYLFNCSSNFTHPQFKGIWNDVAWHQRVTNIIKKK